MGAVPTVVVDGLLWGSYFAPFYLLLLLRVVGLGRGDRGGGVGRSFLGNAERFGCRACTMFVNSLG